MSYSSSPIGAVIADVNVKYFLPAIQRPYVWTADQIVALFDSLLKAYPISTFMFWGVDESTKVCAVSAPLMFRLRLPARWRWRLALADVRTHMSSLGSPG